MKFKRTLIALALGLAPAAAWADPITLVAALAPVIGGTAAAFIVSYGTYILAGGLAYYSSADARRRARHQAADARAAALARLTERSVTVYSAIPAWQIAYGRCTVPGTVIAFFHSDKAGIREDGNTYTRPDGLIHYVVEWNHRQSQAIREVYVDNVAVGPTDANGWATSGDYYSTRVDTRSVIVSASSFADVGDPVITILNAYYLQSSDGTSIDVTPTLSLGNTRITNPAAFDIRVDYSVQANRSSVRVSHHLGTPGQTVDTYLNSVRPTEWDSSHTGQGSTYSVITCDQEDQRFAGGNIPLFQADGDWSLVYDPRSGLTAWSDNNALCLRDWLKGAFGYNCVDADIDDAYTISAANACDTLVLIDDGAGPYSAKKYTCNGCFTSDQAKESVLADLEESMAGHAVYGAQWMIQAGSWTAPVTLPGGGGLTDDDLDGQISIVQADTPMDELFNGMRGTYVPATVTVGTASGYLVNGAHAAGSTSIALNTGSGTIPAGNGVRIAGDDNTYVVSAGLSGAGSVVIQAPGLAKDAASGAVVTVVSLPKSAPTDIRPPYQNSTFVASDGQALWSDVTLPFTNTGGRARNLARILTEKNRSGQVITCPAKLRAIVLQAGDRIPLTSTEYGFAAKVFRVTDRKFGISSPVVLTLQEDDPSIYDEADAATADPTPNTRLPNPWTVQAITGLAATSSSTTAVTSNLGVIAPRVSVTWTAITDRYVLEKGHIEVLWRNGAQPWQQINLPGDSTGVYLDNTKHDDRLVIEVRAVNGLGKVGPSAFYGIAVSGPLVGTTEVFATTPGSAVTITGQAHTPDGFNSLWNTQVTTVSFTPKTSGAAQVFFDGRGIYTTGASAGGGAWSIQDTAGTGTYDGWKRLGHYVPASTTTAEFSMATTRTINVTGGTAYTFAVYANKFNAGDTFTVDNMQVRVEVVKS